MRYLTRVTFVLLLLAAAGFAYERSVSVPGAPSSGNNFAAYHEVGHQAPDAALFTPSTRLLPGEQVSGPEAPMLGTFLVLDVREGAGNGLIVTLAVPRRLDSKT